jgi:hypothetical protein
MFSFIAGNIGTIVITLIVAGIVTVIVVGLVRKKKKGKHIMCDCGSCSGCPSAGACLKGGEDCSNP